MAREPRRIDYSLLGDDVKSLIGASIKAFPVPYDYILENTNPHRYDYVRVTTGERRNEIYIWQDGFKYIGADNAPHNHTKSQITDFAHNHTIEQITDFAHTHTKGQITDFAHNHDDMYNTKSETQNIVTLAVKQHTDDTGAHVTPDKKAGWDSKTKITIAPTQPADNSFWYKEI